MNDQFSMKVNGLAGSYASSGESSMKKSILLREQITEFESKYQKLKQFTKELAFVSYDLGKFMNS